MPELPEVDLAARTLNKIIAGKKIASAQLLRERLAPESHPDLFAEKLGNCGINFVHRRGKHILLDLDNGLTLITHLRMSGRFTLLPSDREDPKFTHAVFYFQDDSRLVFQDQRHFGLMKIVETQDLNEAKELKKLAPEPFSDDFSLVYLRESLKTSKRSIKEFLLDQTKVCGLGNIYAAEALFLAKVHPESIANTVSKRKADLLHDKIREVLQTAITLGSAVEIDHSNIGGSVYGSGSDSVWNVYGRENEACQRCERMIARIKQAGRSTYFCPKCQRRYNGMTPNLR